MDFGFNGKNSNRSGLSWGRCIVSILGTHTRPKWVTPEDIQVVLDTWRDAISPQSRSGALDRIKQIAAQKAKEEAERLALEQAAKKALEKKLKTKCEDLIRARLKRSTSYHSELEGQTNEQLLKNGSEAAKDMLKLIEQETRLMQKNLP